jgi:aminoglycoside 3-N-acetyltransferase I
MVEPMPIEIRHLTPADLPLMHELLQVFGDAFDDAHTYVGARPPDGYLRDLLAGRCFIALVAVKAGRVVGGLAAYELRKFERARSEIYIYDLAVAEAHRRAGVAMALIEALRTLAARRGASVIFVQADTGVDDAPAIALYSKLGTREEVLHFDIPVGGGTTSGA